MQPTQDINHLEYYTPEFLLRKIQRNIPRSYYPYGENVLTNEDADPIVRDLLKLTPHVSLQINFVNETIPIPQYSLYLSDLVNLLLNTQAVYNDASRINIEETLIQLTSNIPAVPKGHHINYPNSYLSKILLDNFDLMQNFIRTYFNLSLTSHLTKFLVELVYNLYFWEVYHLLNHMSSIKPFLLLLDFNIVDTPYGYMITPPKNYLVSEMYQGFNYPFPYPFYNYSFHSFDKEATRRKYSRIHIKPYADISLHNTRKLSDTAEPSPKKKKKVASEQPTKKLDTKHKQKQGVDNFAPESDNFERWKERQKEIGAIDDEDEEDDYNEEDDSGSNDEVRSASVGVETVPVKVSVTGNPTEEGSVSDDEDSKKKPVGKSSVIHQCHLIDPASLAPCLKIFYGKNELLRHQEFVHATKKKIYKCIYCSRNGAKVQSYPRHDSLARHIRRKHGITGKENKMAVNYAKENVEIIDDAAQLNQATKDAKPLPHPQFLNSDFTIKSSYAGFLSFSTRDGQKKKVGNGKDPILNASTYAAADEEGYHEEGAMHVDNEEDYKPQSEEHSPEHLALENTIEKQISKDTSDDVNFFAQLDADEDVVPEDDDDIEQNHRQVPAVPLSDMASEDFKQTEKNAVEDQNQDAAFQLPLVVNTHVEASPQLQDINMRDSGDVIKPPPQIQYQPFYQYPSNVLRAKKTKNTSPIIPNLSMFSLGASSREKEKTHRSKSVSSDTMESPIDKSVEEKPTGRRKDNVETPSVPASTQISPTVRKQSVGPSISPPGQAPPHMHNYGTAVASGKPTKFSAAGHQGQHGVPGSFNDSHVPTQKTPKQTAHTPKQQTAKIKTPKLAGSGPTPKTKRQSASASATSQKQTQHEAAAAKYAQKKAQQQHSAQQAAAQQAAAQQAAQQASQIQFAYSPYQQPGMSPFQTQGQSFTTYIRGPNGALTPTTVNQPNIAQSYMTYQTPYQGSMSLGPPQYRNIPSPQYQYAGHPMGPPQLYQTQMMAYQPYYEAQDAERKNFMSPKQSEDDNKGTRDK